MKTKFFFAFTTALFASESSFHTWGPEQSINVFPTLADEWYFDLPLNQSHLNSQAYRMGFMNQGFAFHYEHKGNKKGISGYDRYRTHFNLQMNQFSFAIGPTFSDIYRPSEGKEQYWGLDLGLALQISRYFEMGGDYVQYYNTQEEEKIAPYLRLRPYGDPRFTFFFGGEKSNFEDWASVTGMDLQFPMGLSVGGELKFTQEELNYQIGIGLAFGDGEVSWRQNRHEHQRLAYHHRSAPKTLSPTVIKEWVVLDVENFSETHGGSLLSAPGLSPQSIYFTRTALLQKKNLGGILLNLKKPCSAAQCDELASAFKIFKEKKIPLWVYTPSIKGATLSLFNIADRMYMPPFGRNEWLGSSTEFWFYKGLLDTLGVEVDVVKHGKYKGAMEPFVQDSLSAATHENWVEINRDLQNYREKALLTYNSQLNSSLKEDLNHPEITPKKLAERGWIHEVNYFEDLLEDLKKQGVVNEMKWLHQQPTANTWMPTKKVAVLQVEGAMISGFSGSNPLSGARYLGDQSFKELLEEIEKTNPHILLLRINSPGGSVLAADEMRHSLERFLERNEVELYVSTGAAAASGGYYLISGAKEIFVQPSTITGSIGVFGGKINVNGLLSKWGIKTQTVKTNPSADATSITRNFSEKEKSILQTSMDEIYDSFTAMVSKDRKISLETTDSLAQGKLHLGMQAVENKLADQLGGMSPLLDTIEKQHCPDQSCVLELQNYSSSGLQLNPFALLSSVKSNFEWWQSLGQEQLWMWVPTEL